MASGAAVSYWTETGQGIWWWGGGSQISALILLHISCVPSVKFPPLSEPQLSHLANEDDHTLQCSCKERGYPRTGELGVHGKPAAGIQVGLLLDKRELHCCSQLSETTRLHLTAVG